ncbi:spermidine/putrescine ABC transporter substrate-binding protein [Microbacterium mangrovi]|uniref:Spermidine/putrescine ABC transporter substrate-binding protein n=1 Tax=Microbacterium mangrovi TaxID=1348253 RepID=A0A0B2A101_9MICO|nr:ABC transporter substrate-binding protein [Microbacterium mangrovi]KHK95235.1 spermidine/putrescine ABC transporter substrate-binding protein [Microbacterium mangrovi]
MNRGTKRFARSAAAVAAVAAAVLVMAGCSGTGTSAGATGSVPSIPMAKKLGANEGQLNIIVWAGYAEDGTNDPKVDWVTPFQQNTGCQVNAKVAGTSDEMVQLMRTGDYDGVSASGDATLRLVYGGQVAPVNTKLVPNYATVSSFLKDKAWNSVGGQMYGIPHGWGANVLMYNTDVVKPAPDSWSAVFDDAAAHAGKVTAYDSPIYIADAALYLKAHDPSLGIKDPYSLTQKQLDAAVSLLKKQKASIGEYWSDYTKAVQSFESGSSVVGTSWQVIANLLDSDKKVHVATTVPKEGSTGWSDTWMISSKAKHPNCMYQWMNWITSPKVNAQVAEWFGEAPAQTKACEETTDPNFCTTYHATDAAYAAQIHYWTTPQTKCVDGSGDNCTPYSEWVTKWQEIKG